MFTEHALNRAMSRNLLSEIQEIEKQGIIDYATVYFHAGLKFLFFGKDFGKHNGLVLATEPSSGRIITCYRNKDFPRYIKAQKKSKNLH